MASHRITAGAPAGLPPFLLVFAFAVAITLPGVADPYELPVQTVTAIAPTEESPPTAGRTVLLPEVLESMGISTLGEALTLVPGIALAPAGAEGAQSTLSIRGSTSNQVLVLIDGIRVSDPATGRVDLSRIGLSSRDIESIEVIRGGMTAQYGADAVGGVVLIRTKRGGSTGELSLAIANTAFLPSTSVVGSGASALAVPLSPLSLVDGQSLFFRASLPFGIALSASAGHSANAYPYYDLNYIRRLRVNADATRVSTNLSWKGLVGYGAVSAAAEFGARWIGVPGTLDAPSPEARQRDLDASFSADYASDYFLSDAIAFDAKGYGRLGLLEYRHDTLAAADMHRSYRLGGDTRWSVLLGEASTIEAGISTRFESLDSTVVKSADGSRPKRVSFGMSVEPRLKAGEWSLLPALRWDWTNDFPSGFSLNIGAAKALNESIGFSISASTAYRAPSFDDLYWPLSNGAEGNPGLGPDLAYCADAGIKIERESFSFSASTFVRYSRDVILWQENDDGIWRPSNFGDAFYPGLELEYSSRSKPWNLYASYGFLYSYVLSGNLGFLDDKRVPGVPVHNLSATGTYESKSLHASITGSYQGMRYLTTANLQYQPAVFLLGFRLEWLLDIRSSLYLKGENLLNERYESVKGFPMPGLSMEMGLEYKLGNK